VGGGLPPALKLPRAALAGTLRPGSYKSPTELQKFNSKRRQKRNSPLYSDAFGCVEKPDSGNGAAARWDKDNKTSKRNRELNGKYESRRWC